MRPSPLVVVVLAAGEGTRMKSRTTPKVLHGFAGRSLLGHVLAATEPLGAEHTAVVVGHGREAVTAALTQIAPNAVAAVQEQQHGTGHATRIGLAAVPTGAGTVVVVPGDAPLLRAETLTALVEAHETAGRAATLLSSVVEDPTGYGRVIRGADDSVLRVVEHKDADAEQLAVKEVAAAVYAFDETLLRDALTRLTTDNAQAEEYLPEVVDIFVRDGHAVGAVIADAAETAGVNDRVQLAAAHRSYNARLVEQHQLGGVTIIDPATTWLDATVTIEPDVTLHPSTELHGATHLAESAEVGPQVTLTDTTVGARTRISRAVAVQATIGAEVTIGPFAYLRPGTQLADGVHIGTYVELKNSDIGAGTKVPHLSYVGDATIGEQTNIGAATVFVNYDGVNKHRSIIGSHARTGADNMFVAPVEVGDGAYTAAGSVIYQDVPPGDLGVARAQQRNVTDWVGRRRAGTAADRAAQAARKSETDSSGE